ncbi:hypothetical protein PoB_006715300 [Plakobranchus ocellatus]|uniref:Secreted protein n=1 Tax=Plakobranchus ocellatus TaxID=259542 RepID=A0AAV4D8T0_9GAST|nr:hypothetical protein PoB_006715300 [Plakobranchus ocellatus]
MVSLVTSTGQLILKICWMLVAWTADNGSGDWCTGINFISRKDGEKKLRRSARWRTNWAMLRWQLHLLIVGEAILEISLVSQLADEKTQTNTG